MLHYFLPIESSAMSICLYELFFTIKYFAKELFEVLCSHMYVLVIKFLTNTVCRITQLIFAIRSSLPYYIGSFFGKWKISIAVKQVFSLINCCLFISCCIVQWGFGSSFLFLPVSLTLLLLQKASFQNKEIQSYLPVHVLPHHKRHRVEIQ